MIADSSISIQAIVDLINGKTPGRIRHLKRGTTYEIIGLARMQCSTHGMMHLDDVPMVIYRGEDGKIWARHPSEFTADRFENVAPPCEHQWIDATNSLVSQVDLCVKCHVLRAHGDRPAHNDLCVMNRGITRNGRTSWTCMCGIKAILPTGEYPQCKRSNQVPSVSR